MDDGTSGELLFMVTRRCAILKIAEQTSGRVFVRCQQGKNGKEVREKTEGKSGRVDRGR